MTTMSGFVRVLATLTAAAVVTACSGLQNSVPASQHGATSARRGTVVFRIRIPKRNEQRARRAAPHYISPATQGMTLAIAGPASSLTIIGLTPTSTGCSSTTGTTTCGFTLSLPPCTIANCYLATIATYDAVSCSTTCSIPPGAHELSAAQNVSFNVAAGRSNAANLTLGGIPASVNVTPLQPGYLQGDAQRLQLWGASPQELNIGAVDADGNTIVGPGSPAISASTANAALHVIPPRVAAPNTAVLSAQTTGSPPAVSPGLVNLSITVTPANQTGASQISLTVPVAIAHSAVYVGLNGNAINVYYDGNTSTPSLSISGSNTNFNAASQLTLDGNGTLYAATTINTASSGVCHGSADGEGTVVGFTAGANGNVSPSIEICGPTTTMQNAIGVAFASSGAMAVVNFAAQSITEFAQGATGNIAPLNTISGWNTGLQNGSGLGPGCAAVDSAATLYVSNSFTDNVVEFRNGATANQSPDVTLTGFDEPTCVALDQSSSLYVTDDTPSIAKFAPGATSNVPVSRITSSSLPASLDAVAIDAAGTMYAAGFGSANVTEYAAGATGNVAPIATINTSGADVRSVYAVPGPNLNVVTS
jgi:hypothetical protein